VPPQQQVPAGPWTCAVCTFDNNAAATRCEMCDTPKQVAIRRQLSRLQNEVDLALEATPLPPNAEYSRLVGSAAVYTTKILADRRSAAGGEALIAGVLPGIARAPTIEDTAGSGLPGDPNPLRQLLRQRSLRVRFANEHAPSSPRAPTTPQKTDGWLRRANSDTGELFWTRVADRDSRKVVPSNSGRKSASKPHASLAGKHSHSSSSQAWVRVIHESGKIEFLNANEFADVETKAPVLLSSSGEESDLQLVAAMPFDQKRVWFRECCKSLQVPWEDGHIDLYVERKYIIQSSVEQIMALSDRDMCKTFKIVFLGENGNDAGGVSREWFTTLIEKLFDGNFGLFETGGEGDLTFQINQMSARACGDRHLEYFTLVGRLLGKALLQDFVVEPHFALPIYKHILGLPVSVNDLQYVDEGLHAKIEWMQDPCHSMETLQHSESSAGSKSGDSIATSLGPKPVPPVRKNGQSATAFMAELRRYHGDIAKWLRANEEREDVKDHGSPCSPFVFAYERFALGENTVVDLKLNGRTIPVIDANKDEYIRLVSRYRLLSSCEDQLGALLIGFYEVIPPTLISIFTFQELELLLCGLPYIDVVDWEASTVYKEGSVITKSSPTMCWFWEVVREMSPTQQAQLLQFSTGSSRVPLGGFRELQTHSGETCPFTILGVPRERKMFPEAHTCFNRLELPVYRSRDELKKYLMIAIEMELRLDLE
jgi:hypothetical protein